MGAAAAPNELFATTHVSSSAVVLEVSCALLFYMLHRRRLDPNLVVDYR
jgi:hypothetical protein